MNREILEIDHLGILNQIRILSIVEILNLESMILEIENRLREVNENENENVEIVIET